MNNPPNHNLFNIMAVIRNEKSLDRSLGFKF